MDSPPPMSSAADVAPRQYARSKKDATLNDYTTAILQIQLKIYSAEHPHFRFYPHNIAIVTVCESYRGADLPLKSVAILSHNCNILKKRVAFVTSIFHSFCIESTLQLHLLDTG
jgi:hypothetical protein